MDLRETRLIAFGDSITRGYGVREGEGWVEVIAAKFFARPGNRVKVLNAGGNGNTSREGWRRFATDVKPFLPATVLIEFGGNDPVRDEARHVKPDEFQENLKAMVEEIQISGGFCILCTFPAVVSELHSTAKDPIIAAQGGLDQVLVGYREIVRNYAAHAAVPLWDLDKLSRAWIRALGHRTVIDSDGIHWTRRANQLAADAAMRFLESTLPKR